MRQGSQAAIAQQGLRDVDRWKDKIEIRLDNRQVAFLFFGSALIACLLFILGVIVGKRLESRGHAIAPEIEDPLALLDRVASTLPVAAAAAPPPAQAVGRQQKSLGEMIAPVMRAKNDAVAAEAARAAATKTAAARVVEPGKAPEGVKSIAVLTTPKPIGLPGGPGRAPVEKPTEKAAPELPPAAAPVGDRPAPSAHAATKPGASPELLPPSGVAANALAAGLPTAGKSRFQLQVGSFLDRAEAEAFASSFSAESPMVIRSEVPGKGTWYRVRVGEFRAFKDAVDAKLSFERRYSKIALVVGPL